MSEFSYNGISSDTLACGTCSGEWGNKYDTPIETIERNCQKILQYELIGLGRDHIAIDTDLVNKTKELYLTEKGEFIDDLTGFENDINIRLKIDTDIYCSYDYKIENGILTIILFEKINNIPEFFRVR
mgnify:CR=1 FL=1